MDGELCRQHAILLGLELEDRSAADRLIGAWDRAISRGDPLSSILAGAMNGVLSNILLGNQRRNDPSSSSPPPPRRPPRAPPPRPAPDPSLRAREILGFEPADQLTTEKVQKRRQALARVFHPDMAGGSEAQMKRINEAADTLLAKLS